MMTPILLPSSTVVLLVAVLAAGGLLREAAAQGNKTWVGTDNSDDPHVNSTHNGTVFVNGNDVVMGSEHNNYTSVTTAVYSDKSYSGTLTTVTHSSIGVCLVDSLLHRRLSRKRL